MIEQPYFRWVGVLLSGFLLISSIRGGEDREQLLTTARDGNRAAILAITSMECRYERLPWANTTLEQAAKIFDISSPGRFWRSGDAYRHFRPMIDGTTLDCVVRDGRSLGLHKGRPLANPILSLQTVQPVDGVGGDLWIWLLFSHWGWNPPSFYPLDDILAHPHDICTVERLAPPAKDIHIELTHSGGRLEFWFDPKVNYLIRKQVMVPAGDSNYRWEDEVVEFAELASAVFVPIIVEHRCSIKGTLQAVLRTTLSEVKINQPLSNDALRLPAITGMDCYDVNRDVKYKVDAEGKAIEPESPYPVVKITPTNTTSGGNVSFKPGDPNAYLEPSRPPTPWWLWILIAALTVLVAALVLVIIRRRRQALQT